ncbi:MAG: HAD family hydrolase [Patescibacteria group bacterium]
MTIILDLDYTLLDTVKFKDDYFSRGDDVLARTGEYLYPGAIEFLGRLRSSGARMVLLTFGEVAWQTAKVDRAGLRPYFDEVIATIDEKKNVIGSFRGGEVVVINDNGHETAAMMAAAPEFKYILKRGPKGVPEGLACHIVDTFDEVEKLLSIETSILSFQAAPQR